MGGRASNVSDPLIKQGGQSGDQAYENVAGRDIHNQGLSGSQLAIVLEQQTEFLLSIVKAYEQQHREFVAEIKQLRKENDIYREGERNQRAARQEMLDRELYRVRRVIFWLGVGILVALIVA